ncbi:hypothetical protein BXZ70DRAFT_1005503 [Cristinia sonorae]|uniref:Transmembrane protein n=1 Tax=Cristinia sonorae TaxID=1940300 RepID=A0A8K0XSR8_9AGAR|nr:hypothetical protein BXZ70DRAFT_1005503 [Cristinia sonorae]
MFFLPVIYASVAVVLSILNMFKSAALIPVQVFDLTTVPKFWFMGTLARLNIQDVPVAHVEDPKPTFFNSISAVPVDAHSLIVRRPALVPSVIVNTTAALSLRQTSSVALIAAESDKEVCVWLPLVPATLEVIVSPVAQQSALPLRSLPRPAQTVKVSTLQAFSGLLAVSLGSFIATVLRVLRSFRGLRLEQMLWMFIVQVVATWSASNFV